MPPTRELILGIGDDAAILRPRRGEDIVVTTDFTLEGRHFRRDWHPAASVGYRALARGLSDLAAMGARPVAAFLSLALSPPVAADAAWVAEFIRGLTQLASEVRCPLAGGDTAQAPGAEMLADIVLLGAVPRGKALRRSGARPRDLIYCSGSLGGASAELAALRAGTASPSGEHPQLFPQPRLQIGAALLRRGLATACMDLSDGLSSDLPHLCAASAVSAIIEANALPVHKLAQSLPPDARMHAVLHGGEDYELLFTCRPRTRMPRTLGGVPLHRIGTVIEAGKVPVLLQDADGHTTTLQPQGWEHFRSV